MIHYDPAHHSFVGFALETGSVTESVNGAAATLSATPTGMALCGYSNHPEGKRGLGNAYGFGIGARDAAYRKRGENAPSLVLTLRGGGAVSLLGALARDSNDELPSLCFWVGVPPLGGAGGWTDVYRFAKLNALDLLLREPHEGMGSEIEVTLHAEAMCRYTLATPLAPNLPALLGALDAPLFWHDVRSFGVNGVDFRQTLAGLRVRIGHHLERQGQRPNWGDNAPLSRTAYHLLEHTLSVAGEMQLHSRLGETYFAAAATAQSWGDITLSISNTGVADGSESALALTLHNCMPSDETTPGAEPRAPIGHRVPFVASDYALSAT